MIYVHIEIYRQIIERAFCLFSLNIKHVEGEM